ncbi:Pentapeptide repeat-containing protein [Lachnospiraceae bacterium XBB1006]|nr:Pentapeptide repeat-containing protein [Lachnospiraceae bacterium XBB1006]
MRILTKAEICRAIVSEEARKQADFSDACIQDVDLSGLDLHGLNFEKSTFERVCLEHTNLAGVCLENALLDGICLRESNLRQANLRGTCLREASLEGCDCRGVDFYAAVLEHTNLTDIQTDEMTKWFRMHCPATGPILGYKKCVGDRLVQLLIPADAKRTSATRPSCRASKAKVLSIWNFDATVSYEEAWSLVDDNFVYRKGQWVEVANFNEDRWFDSTTGIHFWLTREEAIGY